MHAKIDENMDILEYPIMNIRMYLPEVSLPEDLTNDSTLPNGFVYINSVSPPAFDNTTQKIEQTNPVYDGTKWISNWIVTQLSSDELAQININLKGLIVGQTQQHLDAAAIALGYDDIKTAVTYADEPAVPKFQTDGKSLRAWRSLVWNYCYEQLALVEAGTREKPTVDAWVSELPVLAPIQYS